MPAWAPVEAPLGDSPHVGPLCDPPELVDEANGEELALDCAPRAGLFVRVERREPRLCRAVVAVQFDRPLRACAHGGRRASRGNVCLDAGANEEAVVREEEHVTCRDSALREEKIVHVRSEKRARPSTHGRT